MQTSIFNTMLYKRAQLLWITNTDETGPMLSEPPILVLKGYKGIPANGFGRDHPFRLQEPVTVYDILMDGEIVYAATETWLYATTWPRPKGGLQPRQKHTETPNSS